MIPTKSPKATESEKARWPHSCAITQSPVQTAPCHHQYLDFEIRKREWEGGGRKGRGGEEEEEEEEEEET